MLNILSDILTRTRPPNGTNAKKAPLREGPKYFLFYVIHIHQPLCKGLKIKFCSAISCPEVDDVDKTCSSVSWFLGKSKVLGHTWYLIHVCILQTPPNDAPYLQRYFLILLKNQILWVWIGFRWYNSNAWRPSLMVWHILLILMKNLAPTRDIPCTCHQKHNTSHINITINNNGVTVLYPF